MIPYEDEKWEHIASLPRGDLEKISYPVLLTALARNRCSVVLELHRKPVLKRIVFDVGSPVDCRSNLVHETFGRFLVATGKLPEEEFNTALSESLSQGVPIGEILLERELLDAVELYKLLQQNLARKLLDGFTWRNGTFVLEEDSDGSDLSLKVRTPQLILTGVLKLSPMEEVSEGIKPFLTEPLAFDPEPPFDEEEIRFRGAAERVVAALQKKPLRMDELARETSVAADDLGRIVYALALVGLVVPASRLAVSGAARQLGKKVHQTRPIERLDTVLSPLSEEDLDRARRRVLEAFLSFRRKDAFELLEVDEEADIEAIEARYLRYAERFAPWQLEGQAPEELVEKARVLFCAGAEAYAELIDNERRGALIFRRKRRREGKKQEQEVAEPKIETDLLDSEVQFRKGMGFLGRGDHGKALEYLQFAADCDPQNPRYRAEAAHCRWVALNDANRSLSDLRSAVRMDPRSGIAHYYLGVVLGGEGQAAEAEEHLRKAIKLMAPDRRPIEALKELSTKKKRR